MIIISENLTVPIRHMFWENAEDINQEAVTYARAVSRCDVRWDLAVLNFIDNESLGVGDPMAKVDLLLSAHENRFL